MFVKFGEKKEETNVASRKRAQEIHESSTTNLFSLGRKSYATVDDFEGLEKLISYSRWDAC